jgi:hypothetical protein
MRKETENLNIPKGVCVKALYLPLFRVLYYLGMLNCTPLRLLLPSLSDEHNLD